VADAHLDGARPGRIANLAIIRAGRLPQHTHRGGAVDFQVAAARRCPPPDDAGRDGDMSQRAKSYWSGTVCRCRLCQGPRPARRFRHLLVTRPLGQTTGPTNDSRAGQAHSEAGTKDRPTVDSRTINWCNRRTARRGDRADSIADSSLSQ
jgi:hypothetical protein